MVRSRAVMAFARGLARGVGPLLLLLLPEVAESQSSAGSPLDRAARARAAGDLAGSRRILEEALAASPRDGRLAVALAETLIALGQFEPARDLLERLVRSIPDRPEPRRALALVYLNTDQPARALAEATKAAELDPKNPDSHLRLAQAQKAAGQYAQAVRSYQGVLRSRPREAAALHGLATAYAALEDPKAEETYQRLLAVAPDALPLRVDFAEYLWQVGKTERGNEVMAAVVRDAPDNPRLRAHYGLNLVEQRRFVQAAQELEKAIAAGAGDYEALYFLGSALLEVGRFEDAAARFRQAILLAPEKLEARHMLGRVLLLDGKEEAALPELEKAHVVEPKSGAVLLDLGRAREAAGRTAEAEAAYRQALEAEPGLSRAHYALGALLARLGRREEAREHVAIYQTAFQAEQEARLREASRRARLNLGWVELRQGRAERALEQFRRFPDDVEALRGAARALSKLGRHREAAQTYERALAISPEDPRLRYELDSERTALKKGAR